MELTRIAKRSFRVFAKGDPKGFVQRIPFRRRWIFYPFEGCGIRLEGLVFRSLQELDSFIECHQ